MATQNEHKPEQDTAQAAAHIASTHQILKALQEKIGEHPKIEAAITKLEMALNDLAVQTGGLLVAAITLRIPCAITLDTLDWRAAVFGIEQELAKLTALEDPRRFA